MTPPKRLRRLPPGGYARLEIDEIDAAYDD